MKQQWREFISAMIDSGFDAKLQRASAELDYPASFHVADQCGLFLARINGDKRLIAVAQAESKLFNEIQAQETCMVDGKAVKIAELSARVAQQLWAHFHPLRRTGRGRQSLFLRLGQIRAGLRAAPHGHP